jgi:hypothetical protein
VLAEGTIARAPTSSRTNTHDGKARRCIGPAAAVGEALAQAELVRLGVLAARMEACDGIEVEIDLRGYGLSGLQLGGRVWRRLVFGRNHDSEQAVLENVSFERGTLEWCELVGVDLDHVSFEACRISDCDLRYATFRRVRMADVTLERCDLYRANMLHGTELQRARFRLISPPDVYDGVTGLRWSSFCGSETPAVIAESATEYASFLERTRQERQFDRPLDVALRERLENAAESFRTLSAYWDARGQFEDGGRAYSHSQRLLRQSAGPFYSGRPFDPVRWLGLWTADLVCGFGESLPRIFAALAVVALLPGMLLGLLGGASGGHGLGDDLIFSVAHLTTTQVARIHASSRAVEAIGLVQSIMGIALLGLFGFVLGNKIRRS